MNSNDPSTLIDSPAANKLGFFRALAYSEEQGVMEKFRPYALPSAEWLQSVATALGGKTESPMAMTRGRTLRDRLWRKPISQISPPRRGKAAPVDIVCGSSFTPRRPGFSERSPCQTECGAPNPGRRGHGVSVVQARLRAPLCPGVGGLFLGAMVVALVGICQGSIVTCQSVTSRAIGSSVSASFSAMHPPSVLALTEIARPLNTSINCVGNATPGMIRRVSAQIDPS